MNKSTIPVIVAAAAVAVPMQANAASYTKAALQVALNQAKTTLDGYAKPVQDTYISGTPTEEGVKSWSTISNEVAAIQTDAEAEAQGATIEQELTKLLSAAETTQGYYVTATNKANAAVEAAESQKTTTDGAVTAIVVSYVKTEAEGKVSEAKTTYDAAISGINKDTNGFYTLDGAATVKSAADTYESTLKDIVTTYQAKDTETQNTNSSNKSALLTTIEEINTAIENYREQIGTDGTKGFFSTDNNSKQTYLDKLTEVETNTATAKNDIETAATSYELAGDNSKFESFKTMLAEYKSTAAAQPRSALTTAKAAAREYSENMLGKIKAKYVTTPNEESPFDDVSGADDVVEGNTVLQGYIKTAKEAVNSAYNTAITDATDASGANYTVDKHNTMAAKISLDDGSLGTDIDAIDEALKTEKAVENNYTAYKDGVAKYEELKTQLTTTTTALTNADINSDIKTYFQGKLTAIGGILDGFKSVNEEQYKSENYPDGTASHAYNTCLDLLKYEGVEITTASIAQVATDATEASATVAGWGTTLEGYNTTIGNIGSSFTETQKTAYATQINAIKSELTTEAGGVVSAISTYKTTPTNENKDAVDGTEGALKKLENDISTSTTQLKDYVDAYDQYNTDAADIDALCNRILGDESIDQSYGSKEDIVDDRQKAADLKDDIEGNEAKNKKSWKTTIEYSFATTDADGHPKARSCTSVKSEYEGKGFANSISTLSTTYTEHETAYIDWMANKGDITAYTSLIATFKSDSATVTAQLRRIVNAAPKTYTYDEESGEYKEDANGEFVHDEENDSYVNKDSYYPGGWVVSTLDWAASKNVVEAELEAIKTELEKHESAQDHKDCYKNFSEWTTALNKAATDAQTLVENIKTFESNYATYQSNITAVKDLKYTSGESEITYYSHLTDTRKSAYDSEETNKLTALTTAYNAGNTVSVGVTHFFTGYSNGEVVTGLKNKLVQERLKEYLATTLTTSKEAAEKLTDETAQGYDKKNVTTYSKGQLTKCNTSYDTFKDTTIPATVFGDCATVLGKLETLNTDYNNIITDAKVNATAYVALTAANTTVQDTWSAKYSTVCNLYKGSDFSGANDLYVGKMNTELDVLVSEADEIYAAWDAGTANKYNVNPNDPESTYSIKHKESEVTAIVKAAQDNKDAYNTQVAALDALTATADPAFAASADGAVTTAKNTLNDLLTKAETEEIKAVVKAGQDIITAIEGEISAMKTTALQKCNAGEASTYTTTVSSNIDTPETGILARISKAVSDAKGNFDAKVADYNSAVHGEFATEYTAATNYLNSVNNTIAAYYGYRSGGSDGYTAAIATANTALFPYSQKLQNENTSEGNDYTNTKDENGYYDRTKTHWTALKALESEIEDIYNTFLGSTETIAESYSVFTTAVSDAASSIDTYKATTTDYTKKTDADEKFKTAQSTYDALLAAIDKSKSDKKLAQSLEGTTGYIAQLASSVSDFKSAANEAAKVEVDDAISTAQALVTEYNGAEKRKFTVGSTEYTFDGAVKTAYDAAIALQQGIVNQAGTDESNAYSATELQDKVSTIKSNLSGVKSALESAHSTAVNDGTAKIKSDAQTEIWEPYNTKIAAQETLLTGYKGTYSAYVTVQDVETAISDAEGAISAAKTANDNARQGEYSNDVKTNIETLISTATTKVADVETKAKAAKEAAEATTKVGQIKVVQEAANGLIPKYYRAKANDTEGTNTSELTKIYTAISNIIASCNKALDTTTDPATIKDETEADKMVEAFNNRENENVEGSIANLTKRIADADTEVQAYNSLKSSLADVATAITEAQEKIDDIQYEKDEAGEYVLDENQQKVVTEVYTRLKNNTTDVTELNSLSSQKGTLDSNLETDNNSNLCGKDGALVNATAISTLKSNVETLSTKIGEDISSIQSAIQSEKEAAEDLATRSGNTDVYNTELGKLKALYTPQEGDVLPTGTLVSYQTHINANDKDVCGNYSGTITELIGKIAAAKTALETAYKTAQNLNDEGQPAGHPTAFTAEAAAAASTYSTLSASVEKLKTDADAAQAKYSTDLEKLQTNYNTMVAAYTAITAPEQTTKATEIATKKAEIDDDIAAIKAKLYDGNTALRPADSALKGIQDDIDAANEKIEAFKTLCKESAYTPGAISGGNKVEAQDVTLILNMVLGKANLSEMSEEQKKAADMDSDGAFTVADLIQINNIYLYNNRYGQQSSAKGTVALTYETSTLAMDIEGSKMNVKLNGNKPYSAIQMDIMMPSGVAINEVAYAGESKVVMTGINVLENGAYRVVFYAMDGSQINMSSTMAGIKLAGEGTGFVTIDNIMASTVNGQVDKIAAISVGKSIVTGIDATAAFDNADKNSSIFSLNGAMTNTLSKGVNIIKSAAGKVKKVFVK